MTEDQVRNVGMQRDGSTIIERFSNGETLRVQVEYTPNEARVRLVEDWLTPPVRDGELPPAMLHAWRQRRTIRDADGKPVGVLMSMEEFDEGQSAITRVNQDGFGEQGKRYMPFIHHPSGTTERTINVDVLERFILSELHGKDAEVDPAERDRVHMLAFVAAIQQGLEPDSRGMVPVLTLSRAADSPVNEYLWSFVYPTPVAGIYLRPEQGWFGETHYNLMTGSGWGMLGGYYDRDHAERLAVKLAEAAPGIDWFDIRNDTLTPELRETLRNTARAHGRFETEPKPKPAPAEDTSPTTGEDTPHAD